MVYRWREELAKERDILARDLAKLSQNLTTSLRELKQRVGAAWEGMRESRVELGDVMQTLHHLVERSEIQHVCNQMVARAAYSGAAAWGGGSPGVPKHPLISPRIGLSESGTGNAASTNPPLLPQALQHNHRRCLKRGECSCHERLAVTLGAGDPRIALDKLFERQLRLLMSVRALWRQAESARGELPHVPHLPPLPKGAGGAAAAAVSASQMQLRRGSHPSSRGGGTSSFAEAAAEGRTQHHREPHPPPEGSARQGSPARLSSPGAGGRGDINELASIELSELGFAQECEDEGPAGAGGTVGSYFDGGVAMGSGYDEGGSLGPGSGGELPERLSDL